MSTIGISRAFDITFGIDYTNKGVISPGIIIGPCSQRVRVNGRPTARTGDFVLAATGGTGVIMSPQNRVYAENMPVAARFDWFFGGYTGFILDGSPNVILNYVNGSMVPLTVTFNFVDEKPESSVTVNGSSTVKPQSDTSSSTENMNVGYSELV